MRSRAATGWGIGLVVVLCAAAAAVLAWVVVPANKKLPSDTDTTRQLDGTAKLVLNAQALVAGNLRAAVLRDQPASATYTVKVLNSTSDAAQVEDKRSVTVNGQPLGQTDVNYAVNRTSLQAATDHPANWTVVDHNGLTVGWPIGAERRDYTGWINETKATAPLRYVREEQKSGLNTYVYQLDTDAAPIKDQQVLARLPAQIPANTLATLVQSLPLPDQVKAQLAQALPRLPSPVPLTYRYRVASTYWVEPTTGIVVDAQREEIRTVGVSLPNGSVLGEVPIYDVATRFTDQSVRQASNDAMTFKNSIDLYATVLPLILLVIGVIIVIAGVVLIILGRRPRTPTGTVTPSES